MSSSETKKNKKPGLPSKASSFVKAVDGFQGGQEAIRALVDVAGRLNVRSADTLRSMARSLFDKAMLSKKEELKGLAVLARRLSDRLPRTGTCANGDVFSFAAALYSLCDGEFERLCSLTPTGQFICSGSNDENQENDVQQQSTPAEDPVKSDEGGKADLSTGACTAHAPGESPGGRHDAIQRLEVLQMFSACLYTQDVVPEEFVHKLLDFHRFNGGSSWPSDLRFAGLGSAVEMMVFCGKRLEKLGSLKHVMPDFYTFLGDVARDPACPEALRSQIRQTLQLRDSGWVAEDQGPVILHDPPVLGS